jgi:hypothetical protein
MSVDPITALRYDDPDLPEVIAVWCDGDAVVRPDPGDPERDDRAIRVPTRSGPKLAWVGDWVVRRPDGSFDVSTHEQFVAHHEPLV